MATDWRGDEEFARLFDEYRDVVFRWAAKWVGRGEAEDVVQEVMLRAYRARPEISAEQRISPWLRTVTRNVCVDILRRRREVPASEVTLDELSPPAPDEPETAGIRSDARRRLRQAWGRLPARDAEVLTLYDLEGASAAEIAVVRGTTANTVRQQVHRARKVLLRHYRAAGGTLALLPWPGLRRVLRLLRAHRASSALPVATGLALVASVLLPQPREVCLRPLAHRESWLAGREWVPGPSDRPPGPPEDRALVYDSTRREYLVVAESTASTQPALSIWALAPTGWTERRPARPPGSPLRYLLAAHDSGRRRAVVVGWHKANDDMETWSRDGSGWIRDSVDPVPVVEDASLAYYPYSPTTGELVLFGGAFTSPFGGEAVTGHETVSGATWIRRPGQAWTEDTSSPAPPARKGGAMAYDVHLRTLVLFGGTGHGGLVPLDDTWIRDRGGWRRAQPGISPPPRAGAALVDTPAGPLLYGGTDVAGRLLRDVWRWNGREETWEAVPSLGQGPLVDDLQMAYDADADEVLLSSSGLAGPDVQSTYFLRDGGKLPRPSATTAAPGSRAPGSSRRPAAPAARPPATGAAGPRPDAPPCLDLRVPPGRVDPDGGTR